MSQDPGSHGDPGDRSGAVPPRPRGSRLTPREYALATPSDLGSLAEYRSFCVRAGLDPRPDGYGLLMCEDAAGNRITAVDDVDYTKAMVDAGHAVLSGMQIPVGRFQMRRPGWPDEW
jgi:hypothetical protein